MIYGLISLFPLFYKLNARLLKILHGFTLEPNPLRLVG